MSIQVGAVLVTKKIGPGGSKRSVRGSVPNGAGRVKSLWSDLAGEWRGWNRGFADTGRFCWGGSSGMVALGWGPSMGKG